MKNKSHKIRCPKCKWEKEIWIYKNDYFDFLINNGKTDFNSGNFSKALEFFRDAEEINKTNSIELGSCHQLVLSSDFIGKQVKTLS